VNLEAAMSIPALSISLISVLFIVIACGNGDDDDPPPPSNKWNEMKWDEGRWGAIPAAFDATLIA
jgi:hypothetical protein